jgi:hypothetical protein
LRSLKNPDMEKSIGIDDPVPGQKRSVGRPTKKTKAVTDRLFAAIERGMPYAMACELSGISEAVFYQWRQNPAFDAEVIRRTSESVFELLDTIKEARHQNWQSAAFLLERRWPRYYGRAEAQLNFEVAIQNNINMQGANGNHSFETAIVSDLEFLGLRKHESYQHRPHERQAREVEAEVVPEDLSGTLTVTSHPGCSVISATQAASNQVRADKAAQRIDELLRAKRAGNGNAESLEPATASQMVLAPIVMPEGELSQGWWSQLVVGDNSRPVTRETAVAVCRIILRDTLGGLAAQGASVDFESEVVTLRDLHAAIQDLTGPRGWSALLRKAAV